MGFFGSVKASFTLGLFALCLFVVVFAVPASAQEEYQITAILQAPELEIGGMFGRSVAVSGDVVAVGECWADVENKFQAGRVYLFDSSGNLSVTLQSPTPQENAQFGGSHDYVFWTEELEVRISEFTLCMLAVSGDIVVIGERGADVEGVSDAGRAYIISPIPIPTHTPIPTVDYTPYLMAAAVIVVIVAASAVYVMRRKRQ